MIDQITVCTHCRDFAGAVAFQQAPETAKKAVPTGSANLVFIPYKLKFSLSLCLYLKVTTKSCLSEKNNKFEEKGKFTST